MNLFKIFHESPNKQERMMDFPKQKWIVTDGDFDSIRKDVLKEIGQKIYRVHEEGKILYVPGKKADEQGSTGGSANQGAGSNGNQGAGSAAGNKTGGRNKQNRRNVGTNRV